MFLGTNSVSGGRQTVNIRTFPRGRPCALTVTDWSSTGEQGWGLGVRGIGAKTQVLCQVKDKP